MLFIQYEHWYQLLPTFLYERRSSNGCSVPTWLTTPGPVLLKRHVRNSKYEPLGDEVELIEANPQYAHIHLADGKESISIRDLAPRGAYHLPDPLPQSTTE